MIPLGRRRPTAPSGSRAASSLPPLGANKEESFEEEYTLRMIPSIKKYNIARFNEAVVPTFSKCPQPVIMYEEPEKAPDEDEEKEKESSGWNPSMRKRRRRRRKDTRIKNWIIEDNDSKTKFTGTVEGGVTSTYMLMVKTPHKNEFQVVPVEQWFRFKKPLNYRTLTLEEAEEFNNEKKRAVERWLMNHNLAGEKKNDTELVATSTMITGALKSTTTNNNADDIFAVAETKGPRRRRPRKAAAEGDPTGDDGGDFDEVFDDDESGHEVEGPGGKVENESESSDDEFEDGNKDKKAAVILDELLKRTQEQSKKEGATEDGDKNSDDEDSSSNSGQKYKYDDYGRLITSNPSENSTEAPSTNETKPPAPVKPGKRPGDDKSDDTAVKKPKPSSLKLTEAGVQEELIRYGGRMKTRELIKRLKRFLVTNEDKALLRDILRTICDKEEDPVDGAYMVLKTQFR